MMPFVPLVLAALSALILALLIVPVVIRLAQLIGFLDTPDGVVKVHQKVMPYLGGLAVYVSFCVPALLFCFSLLSQTCFLFWSGLTLLFFLGLVDDWRPVSAATKFMGQAVAVICFLQGGFYLKEHLLGSFFSIPLSLLWFLLIINGFNLIDVMDGLASSVACSAAFGFLAVAVGFQQYALATLLAAFIGAVAGFWWYNKPPASIYLGDAGSLFIGGLLAVVPFFIPWGTYTIYGYCAPAIILAVPLLEIAALVFIRTAQHIPFYRASPDHFCLYLYRKGWGKRAIMLFAGGATLVAGLGAALFVFNYLSLVSILLSGATFALLWSTIIYLRLG